MRHQTIFALDELSFRNGFWSEIRAHCFGKKTLLFFAGRDETLVAIMICH
jgi:hypothetical protein